MSRSADIGFLLGLGDCLGQESVGRKTDPLASGTMDEFATANGCDGARRDEPGLPGAKADDADLGPKATCS